jgi:integrase
MEIVFQSILKNEFASFLEFFKLSTPSNKTYNAYLRTLADFDSFLCIEKLTEKKLDAEQIKRFLDEHDVHLSTKKGKLSRIKRFTGFASTLGIRSSLPELPCKVTDFTPYVFTADEMEQIFETADDFLLTNPNSRAIAEFPMLLRILYGCGLRLSEATMLFWDDVDLIGGVIKVKAGKNKKQRLVPMSDELTRILTLYKKSPCFDPQDNGLLFRNNNGRPRTAGAYWSIFDRILCELGIKNPQTVKTGSRGPCIHSLRHTFTMQSFLKAESEGRGFMETVPFLSTYLGHVGLMQTDIYLRARHDLYTEAHTVISDYTRGVFPEEM